MKKLIIGLAVATAVVGTVQAQESSNKGYVQEMRTQYLRRIKFQTPQAREIVEGFLIDCKARDGRSLPLLNVMLARLKAVESKDGYLTSQVEIRGEILRIYDTLVDSSGKPMGGRELAFELNEWGELRPMSIRTEALLNACYGSYGPIWVR